MGSDDSEKTDETSSPEQTTSIAMQSGSEGTNDIDNFKTKNPKLIQDTFNNRRKMAWFALHALLAQTIFVFLFIIIILIIFLIFPDKASVFVTSYKVILEWSATFVGWSFSSMTAIIMTYMGTSSWSYGKFVQGFSKKTD